jgi:hypothetical protein
MADRSLENIISLVHGISAKEFSFPNLPGDILVNGQQTATEGSSAINWNRHMIDGDRIVITPPMTETVIPLMDREESQSANQFSAVEVVGTTEEPDRSVAASVVEIADLARSVIIQEAELAFERNPAPEISPVSAINPVPAINPVSAINPIAEISSTPESNFVSEASFISEARINEMRDELETIKAEVQIALIKIGNNIINIDGAVDYVNDIENVFSNIGYDLDRAKEHGTSARTGASNAISSINTMLDSLS